MSEHKFIGVDSGESVYSAKVFCEYCGLIAYDANRRELTEKGQLEAKEPCPNSPPKERAP